MPYTKDNPPEAIKGLPEHAKSIWIAAFNAAYDGTCKGEDQEACAHKIAWGAVKRAGYKKSGGGWVKSSSPITEFSMHISKAPMRDGKMRVHMTASDTDKDLYDQEMSLELFNNFIRRSKEPVPEAFKDVACDDGWCGGMPYLSVAHYRTGGGKNVPGTIDDIYVDGNRFKGNGTLHDTPLGRAVYKSLKEDFEKKSKFHNPVRISIGFIDLKHSHGDVVFERRDLTQVCTLCENGVGNKKYLDGYLVHNAFTRVPVNPRTSAEVLMAATEDEILDREDDAESIIGDEVGSLVKDSLVSSALIVKSDDDGVEEEARREDVSEADKKRAEKKYGSNIEYADPTNKKYPLDNEEHIRAAWNYIHMPRNEKEYSPEEVSAMKHRIMAAWKSKIDKEGPPANMHMSTVSVEEANMPEAEVNATAKQPSELETTFSALLSKVENLIKLSISGEDALRLIQPDIDNFTNVIRSQFPAPAKVEPVVTPAAEIKLAVAEALKEILPAMAAQSMAEALKQVVPATSPTGSENTQHVPAPRSIQSRTDLSSVPAEVQPESGKKNSFRALARRSTGLPG